MNAGSTIICDKITMAQPSFAAANYAKMYRRICREVCLPIPFVDVAVVNLEFKGNILSEEGFGFHCSNQPDPSLGVYFDTCTFKQGNRTSLTVMMGGALVQSIVQNKNTGRVGVHSTVNSFQHLEPSTSPVRTKTKIA